MSDLSKLNKYKIKNEMLGDEFICSKKCNNFYYEMDENENFRNNKNIITIDKKNVLGEGNYGKIYKGMMINIEQNTMIETAIKIIDIGEVPLEEQYIIDFVCEEINNLCNIKEKHIIEHYGYSLHKDKFYLFLEYIHGATLNNYLLHKNLSKMQKITIMHQLIIGLNDIHKYNIIHNDITADNIMIIDIDENNILIKYIDFGFSCILPCDKSIVKKFMTNITKEKDINHLYDIFKDKFFR
jgi:serine/threonine protein kinase